MLDDDAQIQASMDRLEAMIGGSEALSVLGKLERCVEGGGRWTYNPIRREFGFKNIDGELERIELRCDWRQFRDEARGQVSWKIPDSWGKCKLYVYGEIGANFKLIEYPEVHDTS